VVDHDGQVAVALLVADLVNADPDETAEGVVGRTTIGHHPVDD
jgi:hypothetical protein